MTEMLSQIIGDASLRRRGTLSVRSVPDGAEVYAGDRLLGKTPFTRAAWVGRYDLTFRKPGFAPESAKTEVKDGKTSELDVRLAPGVTLPPPPPPSRFDIAFTPRTIVHPRPFWRWLVGGATIAGGLVLVGFGASAISVSSACSITAPCMGTDGTSYYRDSSALGTGFVVSGLLVSAAGGALIAIPGSKQQSDLLTILFKNQSP
jgi:hypothetical protein